MADIKAQVCFSYEILLAQIPSVQHLMQLREWTKNYEVFLDCIASYKLIRQLFVIVFVEYQTDNFLHKVTV